jgi:hypothetical protein
VVLTNQNNGLKAYIDKQLDQSWQSISNIGSLSSSGITKRILPSVTLPDKPVIIMTPANTMLKANKALRNR